MILLVPTDGRYDCGTVALDATGRVTQFEEKQSLDAPRLINAGIYLLSRERVEAIPADTQVSIEKEIFPAWISNQVTIKSYVHRGSCLDIGTPERFQGAQDLLKDAEVH
jgi:mannose-1-phosphate guanylyltransferase